jgi:uncharacterized protein
MDKFNCQVPNWDEMQKIAVKATDKIKESSFHPDIIIGLSRGGLVPARMFCDLLHVKNCFTIKVDHWGLTATKDGEAKLSQTLNVDLTNKNVLIVDDITDTGDSMKLAMEHIQEKNPKTIKTATMIHLNNSKFTPDFFGQEQDWAWVVFPWNYKEDLVNMTKTILESGTRLIADIATKLKENYNLDIKPETIQEVLDHIDYLANVERQKE